ncbi:MAG: hypothetical protein SNJ57_14015 [Cyanobacteriota bacterium]
MIVFDSPAPGRLPITAGDRQEVGSIRHPALPRHLHPNYQHWQWLSR